jgi:hypothetical protein
MDSATPELGGFLRLSGFNEAELSGQHFGLGTLVYMRQLRDVRFWRSDEQSVYIYLGPRFTL